MTHHRWRGPAQLRQALSTVGFANELRDLLARCTERGVDPVALQRIGRKSGRPEWLAAGQFAQAYEQIMLLRSAVGMAAPQATVPALGAAELVGAALEAFATDSDLLAAERSRIKLLLVDDAQHLDPQAARLVRVLAAGAELTVIAGDANQAVFGYRGADPSLLRGDEPAIILTRSLRCAPVVADAITAVARRLPGVDAAREVSGADDRSGSLTVRIAATPHAESALIADALRRAHLVDGVPWSQMAVIVRSVPRLGATLARALVSAGVPVETSGAACFAGRSARGAGAADGPRRDGARARRRPGAVAADRADRPGRPGIASSAAAGAAPRRWLPAASRLQPSCLSRRSTTKPERCPPIRDVRCDRFAPCSRPRAAAPPMGKTRATHCGRPGIVPACSVAGWPPVSAAASQARRPTGTSTRSPHCSTWPSSMWRAPRAHRCAASSTTSNRCCCPRHPATNDRSPTRSQSSVAHAALGREWEFVVIAGLQEGLWPNTIPRGGVLGTQQLVDVMDGVVTETDRGLSSRAPLLAEERRLLIAAMGRARSRLLVTAVDSDNGDESMLPSPFCYELAALATDPEPDPPEPIHAPRVLAPPAVVGRLRAVVCAAPDAVDDAIRICAATQLARLAQAGVAGADPAQWYGMTPLSSDEPLWTGDEHVVTLSPSTLQTLTDCPLRWLLERHGGTDGRDVRSAVGSLLHALVAESGKTESQMLNELEKVWSKLPFDSQWYSDNEFERHRAMLSTFAQWRTQTRDELTEMGTEIDVDGAVTPGVRVRGRLDRLERDSAGRLVVVDIKTGKTPVSKDDAQRHAQLAMYQLAVAEGLLPQGDTPGGGRLVYLGKPQRVAPQNASRTRRQRRPARSGSNWCSRRRAPPRGRSS